MAFESQADNHKKGERPTLVWRPRGRAHGEARPGRADGDVQYEASRPPSVEPLSLLRDIDSQKAAKATATTTTTATAKTTTITTATTTATTP